jgi:hypothetical protein
MKSCFILLVLLSFAGCKHHVLLNRSKVKMITVVRYRDENDSIVVNYTDATTIRHIVNDINTGKRQPIYFDMSCKLHLIYPDSTITVTTYGSALKYKGATYRMNESIEEILN